MGVAAFISGDPLLGGVIALCFLSGVTCSIVYILVSRRIGRTPGLIAWLLLSLDPFFIQWSFAWLDLPMLLFLVVFMYVVWSWDRERGKHSLYMAGLVAGCAFLTKYTAIPLVVITLACWGVSLRDILLTVLLGLGVLGLNPQYWVLGLKGVFQKELQVLNVGPPLLLRLITQTSGIELSRGIVEIGPVGYRQPPFFPLKIFAWAVTYAIGLSHVGYDVWLFISSFIAFFLLSYRLLKKDVIPTKPLCWLGVSILVLLLLPKYFEYYSVILAPPVVVLVACLLTGCKKEESFHGRFLWIPCFLSGFFLALSPIALVFSLVFPTGWLFIHDIIANEHVFPLEAKVAWLLTYTTFTYATMYALLVVKKSVLREGWVSWFSRQFKGFKRLGWFERLGGFRQFRRFYRGEW